MDEQCVSLSPNQRLAVIHKTETVQSLPFGDAILNDPYCKTSIPALRNAMKRMNGKRAAGYLVWSALQANADGFNLRMGNAAFKMLYGITKDAYDRGIKILIEEGFLVPRDDKRIYDFYDYPAAHRNAAQTSNSGEKPLSKVGETHFQKSGNPTFNSGESPQDNTITDTERDIKRDKENHGVHGVAINAKRNCDLALSHSDILQRILEHLAAVGFVYNGNGHGGLSGWVRRLLKEGYSEQSIIDACYGAIEHNANDQIGYAMRTLNNEYM